MLTILRGLAEFERLLIKARTDVGIKQAREAGIKFGRPGKLTKHQKEQRSNARPGRAAVGGGAAPQRRSEHD
jgi:DNA invertase Pin-like site-specific DNA recombinase